MICLVRLGVRALEFALALPLHALRAVLFGVVLNPRLGPLRHVVMAAAGFLVFAFALVYVVAPLRALVGHKTIGAKLAYDSERWLATAIYDRAGRFVGIFDPRLDSRRDVNYTDQAIEIGDYVANPDHKSIPVREVPEAYWQCLVYHEDRYIGSWLNPFGIDLLGVLKIPYSSVRRSIALRRPALGVGGSTLPMQFARVIYKTPPGTGESSFTKLRRKFGEWWLAPVIYHELTRGGDMTPLKQWAANHIWLAQRTGGQPLQGVELTARIVFGKEAKDLSTAEQFVLASAVNKPIILLPGSDKLNEVRLDRWKYITEVRARTCAERLIADEAEQKQVFFELFQMAAGPPDPRVKPQLQAVLDTLAPAQAKRAVTNPVLRANALLPAARFGMREEMKQAFGFGWREQVRDVMTTLDVAENLAFHERIKGELGKLDLALQGKLNPGWTLDPAKVGPERRQPGIAIVAANAAGEIVRYYEAGETASYFGSPLAREAATGHYDAAREPRMIASTAKMLAAIAIANEGRDGLDTPYQDSLAPAQGLDTCEKGSATHGRRAVVAFACSLNKPLEWRAVQLGQARIGALIDRFGFAMPARNGSGEGTPPSTAVILGQIGGAPQRVHFMSSVVLAALTDQGGRVQRLPSLIRSFDHKSAQAAATEPGAATALVPNAVVRPAARGMLKALLQAPLCHRVAGVAHGTLKSLAHWCPEKRADLRLHFAKTGTQVTLDPNATVDAWITGGLQFANGAAYSYVVVVGTGHEPYARSVHGAQIAPLLDALLGELKADSVRHPASLPRPVAAAGSGGPAIAAAGSKVTDWRTRAFSSN